ncbi:MAG: S8 family serine peptidase, partial [Bryobacteraceae bacterium]|nr:S8 family serine peptidase [Bryobacteraceae bacterium]
RPLKRHLDTAVTLMNVPAAWSTVNGPQNAGAGVKIAVLDSGIDISHPSMQDSSLQYPAGFPKCAGNDCNWVNTKVIVARSYVNLLVGTEPQFSRPDDLSPRDRVGHGTAVATVAAGVRAVGPTATVQGVAPRAWLGNYKIFGSPGVNGQYTYDDVLITALRNAVDDGMDIAVLSLGAPAGWGPNDSGGTCNKTGTQPCDWRAAAVENATRLGMTVVVSAGNDGGIASVYPAFNSIHSPGSAPSAITVGATTNSHIYYQSIRITGPNVPAELQRINAYFTDGPRPDASFRAPVRDISRLGDDGKACAPLATGSLNGAVALIARGDCQYVTKINNAQKAGAVGVILYQSQANANGTFPIRGLEETGIPAALIGNNRGVALKDYVGREASATAAFDATLTSVSLPGEADRMASFSSRGPSIRDGLIKPELVAVGTDLYTATQTYDPNGDLYDPSGYVATQGTSFAAPMVAGAVAIVKQRNPRMTPAQLKSAVVNTANNLISDVDGSRQIQAEVLDKGAGKLDAGRAAQTNVTVEPSTLSFGVLGQGLPANATALRFCNFGTGSVTLNMTVVPFNSQTSSASVTLSSSSLTVAAGACSSGFTARLNGTRPTAGLYQGAITVAGGSVPLRIPYMYIVGDGFPFSVFPLKGDGFEAIPGVEKDLEFKVVDRYGAPVANAAVRFQTTLGDGSVKSEGKTTDELGIGFATIVTGRQLGDQEFFAFVGPTTSFGLYFIGYVRPEPALTSSSVVDAASQQTSRGFAPGSYISIYGRGLSDTLRSFNTPYLPLALAGVSVSFDVASPKASYPGRIQFVSDGQINVQIPWELAGAPSAQMKVSIGDYSSSLVTVPIGAASPSLFEYPDSSGRLYAAAVGGPGVIGTGNTAKKGSVISLYANGLGVVDNQPASGEPASLTTLSGAKTAPTVTIGGRPAAVSFAGLAPGYVGLYQINVTVPADAPSGVQPVVVTSGTVSSKVSNIPVE